jgi:acetyltransferase-like isoleucine patch superfamily enzyme
VKIGKDVQIGPLNWFDFVWPNYIEIGDGVSIAGMCTIIAHSTPLAYHSKYFESFVKPVRIGKNVWVAVGCTILPGTTIGDGAVVAAGSVVVSDIKEESFAYGIPAKQNDLEECETLRGQVRA